MTKHFKYARYIIRHKAFVFLAGLKTGAPLWRLLIHDWTKLLPSEWFPYTDYFYGDFPEWDKAKIACPGYMGKTKESVCSDFNKAWLHHIHWNKHHWQYWCLLDDPSGHKSKPEPLMMPDKYVREMVADWAGAGRAITGKWNITEWYEPRRKGIILHPDTRKLVEYLIEENRW